MCFHDAMLASRRGWPHDKWQSPEDPKQDQHLGDGHESSRAVGQRLPVDDSRASRIVICCVHMRR